MSVHPIFEQAMAPFIKPLREPIWRPVVGYEGIYDVSSLGQVRSLPRNPEVRSRGYFPRPGKILSPAMRNNYPAVLLYKNRDREHVNVHTIVLEAFAGPRPDGMQASHLDGDTTNNASANLEWATPKQNNAEKLRHGTQLYGEDHHASKLTLEDVRTIIQMDANRCKLAEISEEVGISVSQVRNVLTGGSWKAARENIDWAPYCIHCGPKSSCTCPPHPSND